MDQVLASATTTASSVGDSEGPGWTRSVSSGGRPECTSAWGWGTKLDFNRPAARQRFSSFGEENLPPAARQRFSSFGLLNDNGFPLSVPEELPDDFNRPAAARQRFSSFTTKVDTEKPKAESDGASELHAGEGKDMQKKMNEWPSGPEATDRYGI